MFSLLLGLAVLQKNDQRVTGKNWMQKAESLVDHGGSDHLKLSKIHFAGMGTSMIRCWPSSTRSQRDRTDGNGHRRGGALAPCQMTMDCTAFNLRFHRRVQPIWVPPASSYGGQADIQLFIDPSVYLIARRRPAGATESEVHEAAHFRAAIGPHAWCSRYGPLR